MLFRTAAGGGENLAGVVLSGALDDGTAGLAAIKNSGGFTVQDPDEALYASMPRSALDHVEVDLVAGAGQIMARLRERMRQPGPSQDPGPERSPSTAGNPMSSAAPEEAHWGDIMRGSVPEDADRPSPYGCPHCNGVLWQVEDDRVLRFRCRVGHAWSVTSLLAQHPTRSRRPCGPAFGSSRSGPTCRAGWHARRVSAAISCPRPASKRAAATRPRRPSRSPG